MSNALFLEVLTVEASLSLDCFISEMAKRKYQSRKFNPGPKNRDVSNRSNARRYKAGPFAPKSMAVKKEWKHHDQNASDASSGTGFVWNSLNLIAQGTTQHLRIGRTVVVKMLEVNAIIELPATTSAIETTDQLRVIFFVDKQANGASALTSDVIDNGGGTSDWHDFYTMTNKGRFTILTDKTISVQSTCGSGTGAAGVQFGRSRVVFKMKRKMNLLIEFADSTANMTAVRSNNIGLLVISETGHIQYRFHIRVSFVD